MASVKKSMKYYVNTIEYDSVFHMCGRLEVKLSNHCPCIHKAYLWVIFVKIFSVVASVNFTLPYNIAQ